MVYSPSSREEFAFCPRKFWFRKHGLVSKYIEYPELCAIGGNAFGKAMEEWNKGLMAGVTKEVGDLREIATRHAHEELTIARNNGRIVHGIKAAEFLDMLPSIIWQAVDFVYKENPLKPYAILAAEEVYPQYGNSRCDVRVKQADGRQIIWDYKVKFGEVKTRWLPKNIQDYANREQRFTYTTAANVDLFGIIMVVMKPMVSERLATPMIVMEKWPVTDLQKETWLRDAKSMTSAMERTLIMTNPKEVQGRPYPHGDNFGECVYSKACLDYDLNEEKMKLDYVQIERSM